MLNDIMSSLGSSIVLPIFIFLFALCFKVKPGTSFKSAIFIGIGLIGISAVCRLVPALHCTVLRLRGYLLPDGLFR